MTASGLKAFRKVPDETTRASRRAAAVRWVPLAGARSPTDRAGPGGGSGPRRSLLLLLLQQPRCGGRADDLGTRPTLPPRRRLSLSSDLLGTAGPKRSLRFHIPGRAPRLRPVPKGPLAPLDTNEFWLSST